MQVEELEKEIMESREKIEFYRAKMQELVSVFLAFFLCILLRLLYRKSGSVMHCFRAFFQKLLFFASEKTTRAAFLKFFFFENLHKYNHCKFF